MKKKYLVLTIILAFSLVACGKKAPDCSSQETKSVVLQIANDKLARVIFGNSIMSRESEIYGLVQQLSKEMDSPSFNYYYYDSILDIPVKSTSALKIIAIIEDSVSESNLSLTNIRSQTINNEVRKCECVADIAAANGNKFQITYTCQYNDDNELYVEVSGL